MKKTVKFISVLLCVALLAASLAGCGGSKQTAAPPAAEAAGTPEAATNTTDAPEQEAPVKDSLVFSINVDNDTLDTLGSSAISIIINSQVYESLTKLLPDGTLSPCLAESWEVSEDGTVITFKIRQGVKFHNGDMMTADDVVYSLNRLLDSPYIGARGEIIDSIEKTDDYTVVMNLTTPFAPILEYCSLLTYAIVNQKVVEAAGGTITVDTMVGTGPYTISSWVSGERTEMLANDDYWGGAPSIKKLTWLVQPDKSTAAIALERGEIDVLYQPNASDIPNLSSIDSITVQRAPSVNFLTLFINTNVIPDKEVRQAMVHALNKEELVYAYAGDSSYPVDSFILNSSPLYTEAEGLTYDPDLAKTMLENAGAQGLTFDFAVVPILAAYVQASEIYQAQLAQVGVSAGFNQLEYASFVQDTRNGDFDVMIKPCTAGTPDPDSIFSMFVSDNKSQNYPQYKNPEYDALVAAAEATYDQAERKALYAQMTEIIIDEAIVVPICPINSCLAYNSALKGVEMGMVSYWSINNFSW